MHLTKLSLKGLHAVITGGPTRFGMAFYFNKRTCGTALRMQFTRMLPAAGVLVPKC